MSERPRLSSTGGMLAIYLSNTRRDVCQLGHITFENVIPFITDSASRQVRHLKKDHQLTQIDFARIRSNVDGQRSSFEQLVCHLARIDCNGNGNGNVRRIDGRGGDGGVEALWTLPNGRKIGYQAKYYTHSKDIDWNNLDESVRTALKNHPQLERYVIAIPCDFTGRRAARGGTTDGAWGKWDKWAKDWNIIAKDLDIAIEFEPWTAFELEALLLQPHAQHLIGYFFDQLLFSREWMRRQLDRTMHDLQARYSPGDHVDTRSLKTFDVIYRRDNVRQDLHAVFELARASNPRAAAELIDDSIISESDIVAVEKSLTDFLALEDSIDQNTADAWPVCEWFSSWYSLTRGLHEIRRSVSNQIDVLETAQREILSRQLEDLTKAYQLTSPEVFGGHWAHILPVDGSRAILFVGTAGSGKSHALAHGSETAWNDGAPVIHILGQHLLSDDPRASILQLLELADWSFHEFLTSLDLAAEAAGTRAMLVIDALNEGRGTEIWRNHLASFIREVNEHNKIFLVMSCREEYIDYVVLPREIIAQPHPYPREVHLLPVDCALVGKLVKVVVSGFQTLEEREAALKRFMDDNGIARPTAPMLDTEFFNPLFMSSVCRAMAKAGIKVFPRGFHGTREYFSFVLEMKAKALGTRHDANPKVHNAMRAALAGLAGIMVANREDKVPLADASRRVASAFAEFPITDNTWLHVLEGSDILRRDVENVGETNFWSEPSEVIRFSFQRLQDNLIAEQLLSECNKTSIDDAFNFDAPFAFLLRRSTGRDGIVELKFNPSWVGVLGALWALVAEKFGKELYDLSSFFGDPHVKFDPHLFRPVFHTSIRERKETAFTKRTKELLDHLWVDEQAEKLAIILSTACIPNHAWNADFLADRLLALSLAERESAWSRWFSNESSKLNGTAMDLADWAITVDAHQTDPEVARLAGIAMTCLFTVPNSTIRDQAVEGLKNLWTGHPKLMQDLEERFRGVGDFNIYNLLLSVRSS
jgi:hypothetical protein